MKKWIIIIFLLNLVLRLSLLSWNTANFTDSIYYMTALDQVRGTYILPGYPFAIVALRRVIEDRELAGRLVSMIAACLAIFPLFSLARIVYGRRAALFTILLYTFSPLIFRWSLRIFPHGLFSLLVILFAWGIFKCLENGRAIFLIAGIFSGGLAVLTYPTGMVLIPAALIAAAGYCAREVFSGKRGRVWAALWPVGSLALILTFFFQPEFQGRVISWMNKLLEFFPVNLPGPILIWRLALLVGGWLALSLALIYLVPRVGGEKGWWYRKPATLLVLALSFSGYIFLDIWQKRISGSTWYQQGMQVSWRSVSVRWELWLSSYLESLPYVLVYPVAAAAVLGLVLTVIRSKKQVRRWLFLAFYLYFLTGIFYSLVINKWWTPRYQYTLVPFSLILAAYGLSWLWSLRKLRWLGVTALVVCLAASIAFTALVLCWSRDTFGDIKRSAEYIKDHHLDRRMYASERYKTKFWSGRKDLLGYTQSSRFSVQSGDLVLLVGWHTNLNREFRDLNRRFESEVIHREEADIIPLLADDIVDWAGRNLRRRANDPVVWEERFEKQHFETWLVELGPSRGEGEAAETPEVPSGKKITNSFEPLITGKEIHATYFDVGVWELLTPVEKGVTLKMEMAHSRKGPSGSFRMAVYSDRDGDGFPDKLEAQSPLMEGTEPGQWSGWEFAAPGGRIFLGSSWSLGNWVFYERGAWPQPILGEVMYYARGGIPKNKAHPIITNLKVSRPSRESRD